MRHSEAVNPSFFKSKVFGEERKKGEKMGGGEWEKRGRKGKGDTAPYFSTVKYFLCIGRFEKEGKGKGEERGIRRKKAGARISSSILPGESP